VTDLRTALTKSVGHPVFAVFYGTSERDAFSKIVDGFGTDGYKWVGKTLCVLVRHPRARGPRLDWRDLGRELCHRTKAGNV
jgi:hypothetical protein